MSKKNSYVRILLIVVAAAVCDAVLLVIFNSTFSGATGKPLPWWAYIVATVIFALIAYLVYLLVQIRLQRFDRLLARENFHIDKRYEANGQKFCIDFTGKRIADTYLSTKTFVPFEEIVGCRVESFRYGSRYVLPTESRYLGLVIAVNRDEPTPDRPYLYISMFEVKVAAEDVPETPDVTEEMVAKYPELQPLYDMKKDVELILEANGRQKKEQTAKD